MRDGTRKDGSSEGRKLGNLLPTFRRFRTAFKQVVGMPDYPRYLAHTREHHPECRVLSEREFYEQYIAMRYGAGGSRCC